MPRTYTVEADRPTLLARRLTDARLAKQWRQEDVARTAGCAQSQIAHWERGRIPTLDNLIAVADALEVSLDWLLGRDTFAAPSGCGDAVSATGPAATALVQHDGPTTRPTVPPGSRSGAVVATSSDAA